MELSRNYMYFEHELVIPTSKEQLFIPYQIIFIELPNLTLNSL